MVSTQDFINLSYSSDLTQIGLAYAHKHINHIDLPKDRSGMTWMREITAEIGIELAFRRYLQKEKVPYKSVLTKPFTEPDRPMIAIGGRRCKLENYLLSQKQQIRKIRTQPELLLEAPAIVPIRQKRHEYLNDDDIYLFTFLCGLITPNLSSLDRAIQAEQPIHLVHLIPETWSSRIPWRSMGTVTLQSREQEELVLTLGGLDEDRNYLRESIRLGPGAESSVKQDFYKLTILATDQKPEREISLSNPTLGTTHLIQPAAWENIWVYGMDIILAGYMLVGEYHSRAQTLPPGSLVLRHSRTRRANLSLPVASLNSLNDLFNRARLWHSHKV